MGVSPARSMRPIVAVGRPSVQSTSRVTVVAGAGKTELVQKNWNIHILTVSISSSPHIILNQSGIGMRTSRGWEMPAGRTNGVGGVSISKVRVAGTGRI